MKSPSKVPDPILEPFDKWLRESRVHPSPRLLEGIRQRLQQQPVDPDAVIDSLLRPNPDLKSPRMLEQIRTRLIQEARPQAIPVPWLKWLPPLAAAALLTLAFVSFQITSDDSSVPMALQAPAFGPSTASSAHEAELTEIFALAANLEGPGNVSLLHTMDDLAFLFD